MMKKVSSGARSSGGGEPVDPVSTPPPLPPAAPSDRFAARLGHWVSQPSSPTAFAAADGSVERVSRKLVCAPTSRCSHDGAETTAVFWSVREESLRW